MIYQSIYYGAVPLGDGLAHHGIKGQKWGVRRYQNPDGTLTALGKKKYGTAENFNRVQDRKKRRNRIIKGAAIGAGIGAAAYAANSVLANRSYKKASDRLDRMGADFARDIKKASQGLRDEYDYVAKTQGRLKKNNEDIDWLKNFRKSPGLSRSTIHEINETIDFILKDSRTAVFEMVNSASVKRGKQSINDIGLKNMTMADLERMDLW